MSGKRWSSDSGLTNQKARLDHVTSAEPHVRQLIMERGGSKTCSCEAERERG